MRFKFPFLLSVVLALALCACGKDAIASGVKAGDVVRQVAQIAGGNGGGKPDFARAGGKDISKVDDAIASCEEIVRSMIK